MFDILDFMWIAIFCFLLGFFSEKFIEKMKTKSTRIKETQNKKTEVFTENEHENFVLHNENYLDPIILRGGMKVGKNKKPSFVEQCVNIMKFVGENQMEVDYEEESFGSENDME